MMIGQHEFLEHNFAIAPSRMLAYDFTNRVLAPAPELEAWLKENARGPWVMDVLREGHKSLAIVRFADDRDPILFKLFWSHQ